MSADKQTSDGAQFFVSPVDFAIHQLNGQPECEAESEALLNDIYDDVERDHEPAHVGTALC